jgi:hypothetical protein
MGLTHLSLVLVESLAGDFLDSLIFKHEMTEQKFGSPSSLSLWNLNSGLCTCEAGALLLEPFLQSLCHAHYSPWS